MTLENILITNDNYLKDFFSHSTYGIHYHVHNEEAFQEHKYKVFENIRKIKTKKEKLFALENIRNEKALMTLLARGEVPPMYILKSSLLFGIFPGAPYIIMHAFKKTSNIRMQSAHRYLRFLIECEMLINNIKV